MKRDILKVAMAISCIILALVTATYLNDLEYKAKKEAKKKQNTEAGQIYENNLNNTSFNLPVLLIYTYLLFQIH